MPLRILVTVLFLLSASAGTAYAHAGHSHPTDLRISRSTHVYLQATIVPYLKIQKALAGGKAGKEVNQAASIIVKEINNAVKAEKERTGLKMYKQMVEGAEIIASSKDLSSARDGFTALNNTIIPFFRTWTGHLGEHSLTLFECNDKRAGWMQKGENPEDPYRGIDGPKCSGLKTFKP